MSKNKEVAIICALLFVLVFALVLTSIRAYRYLKARKNMNTNNFVNPVKGTVTSKFGTRTHPVTGKQQTTHNGVDIAVPIGTTVAAPSDGRVEKVYSNATGGNQLIIVHTNGWRTGYAHLQQSLVRVGDNVRQGQTVALTGNTGRSTGAHLHFTLTNPNGVKQNPQDYFTF